jgi:hypothetical protein
MNLVGSLGLIGCFAMNTILWEGTRSSGRTIPEWSSGWWRWPSSARCFWRSSC